MELFHYTYRRAAERILDEGIHISGRVHPGEEFGDDVDAVSLTTSKSADGHGLSNGECLVKERLAIFCLFESKFAAYDKVVFPDKTEVRITINIDDLDPKLVSWSDYCDRLNAPIDFRWSAEFAGLFSPGVEAFNFVEHDIVQDRVRSGFLKLQGATWWFYEGNVPKEWIVKIEDRVRRPGKKQSKFHVCLPHLAHPPFGQEWVGVERKNVLIPAASVSSALPRSISNQPSLTADAST